MPKLDVGYEEVDVESMEGKKKSLRLQLGHDGFLTSELCKY